MAQPRIPLHQLTISHFRTHLPGNAESQQLFDHLQSILARCRKRLTPGSHAFQAASWTLVSRELLSPSLPWPLHELLYNSAFAEWEERKWGPPPVWTPLPGQASETNIGMFLRNHGAELFAGEWDCSTDPASVYPRLQRLSYDNPEAYWPRVLKELNIVFHKRPHRIADFTTANEESPTGRWLPGASLNIAESCLEPSIDGRRRDDRLAIVFRDEQNPDSLGSRTLKEVRELSRVIAAGLVSRGLGHGARVAVFLPMGVESVCAYLGVILAGGVVVSVAESFSALELKTRLSVAGAQGIITQDVVVRGGKALPLYSRVVEACAPPAIVLQACTVSGSVGEYPQQGELREGDILFAELVEKGRERESTFTPPAVPSDSFCQILFSSGTTGTPKAIPWSHTVPIKAAADAFMHQDVRPGDVLCWPTSLGWMMGPWLIFSALVNGATIALYQGNPGARGFLKFVQDGGVTMLGVIPSLVRAWRTVSSTSDSTLDWSSIRVISSTGEASSPPDMQWVMSRVGYRAPVIEYCGGTEIGGAFISGSTLQPQGLSSFSTPCLGASLVILHPLSRLPLSEGECGVGECALMPRMLGSSSTLLNADNFQVYFRGMPRVQGQVLRRHGDAMERLPGGYYRAHGRVDDTMNLGGIKVSSVEIERVCNLAHPCVVETAAIGVPPEKGGPEELVVFAVVKGGESGSVDVEGLRVDFTRELRKQLNPLFKVARVKVVKALPRTATNKVLRRQLRESLLPKCEGVEKPGSVSKL